MTNYADAGNGDRLYDAEFSLLEEANYDPEIAGARLLGRDTARLASDTTHAMLTDLSERDFERIAREMTKSIRHDEGAQTKVEARLQRFRAGMLER